MGDNLERGDPGAPRGRVDRAVRAAIADHGPIGFDEYMELALYSPGGFYESPPVGPDAHFVTSPHTHEIFGELLATALRRQWEQLGRPSPFPLVEVGAGDGTLARQLLGHLEDLPFDYTGVERSAGARERLAGIPGVRVAERLDDVPAIRDGVVVANELLDNLPFRRVRMLEDRPVELRVELRDGRLRSTEVPCDGELLALLPDGMGPGEESAIPTGALVFVDELARLLERGGAILIDYGATTTRRSGEVHGYRNQRVVGDVLTDPGESDITAGVDFRMLAARLEERGLRVDGIPRQRSALSALGFEEWIHGQLDRQGKLLRERAGIEAVRIWSGRSRATLLVDPGALGRLRWFVASTRDSPRPDWLPASTDDGLPF